ncbi:hypothetical protein evm_010154 [Chilo suppressalis]|nr:hypothetical protein evm_010154 [Chilo suppressalis]
MAQNIMKRVMAPIQDMHGIRQGRNSTTAHCILCNTSLITKEGHIASFIHKNSLTAFSLHTVTKDPNSKVTAQPNAAQAKTGITYCQPCDRLIHTNNFDAHTKGAIHKTNVKAEIDRKSNETDNNINKANVIVPTSSLNTVTKEQNSKVTAQPNAAQTKTGTTYCQPCDRLIHTHNFDAHTKGAIHKTNVNTKAKNKTHCAPCNIYVDTNNLNSHLSGQRHKTNVDLSKSAKTEQLLETKASTSRRDPATESQNYCDVCEKYVNKTQFSYHVNGGPHKQNLIKKITKEVANFNTSHLKIKNNKVICEICEVEFDITKSKLHVNSATHDETLNRILEKNKIEKESDCLFCSLCCDNISNNELVAHVSMSTHKKLLACSNFQYYCEICDVYVPDTEFNINGHVNGNRHKKKCVDHNSP